MKNKFIYFTVFAAVFAACEPEFENEISNGSYNAGDADFSSYIAIGNSLTAGVMDGTVSRVSQSYSFPSMLAQQFAIVGGGPFTQPSFAEDVNNVGGLTFSGLQIAPSRLVLDISEQPRPRPEPLNMPSTITLTPQATAYNNMGVPGAKSFHILAPGYGNPAGLPNAANPYFVRTATSPSATILDDAMSKNPTFFTNWIGNNDVLSFATSGGTGVNQAGNMNPATYGNDDITDPNVFAATYSAIINKLTENGAKGVVATIPNVTSIPHFTTVPYNPVPMTAAQAAQANQGFAPYNAGLQTARQAGLISTEEAERRTISFSARNNNRVVIVDEYLTNLAGLGLPSYRQATAGDLILLPASSLIGTPVGGNPALINGISVPLEDKWTLVAAEIEMINEATESFNNSIRTIAASKGLAVADMNAILNQLVSGLRVEDGQIYTTNYFSLEGLNTTLFSLDGIHPNARGYAVITNEVIKVINRHYNAKLPLLSAANYPGPTLVTSN